MLAKCLSYRRKKKSTSGVSALSPGRLTCPLLPWQTHWQELSSTLLYLPCATKRVHSMCIPRKLRFASWPGRSILCQQSRLMDHCVAAPALKITSTIFSNTLLNYTPDLQRGGYRRLHIAHQAVCLTKLIKWGWCSVVWAVLPARGGKASVLLAQILEHGGWV